MSKYTLDNKIKYLSFSYDQSGGLSQNQVTIVDKIDDINFKINDLKLALLK